MSKNRCLIVYTASITIVVINKNTYTNLLKILVIHICNINITIFFTVFSFTR